MKKPLHFGVIATVMESTIAGVAEALLQAQRANSFEIRLDSLYAKYGSLRMREILVDLAKLIDDRPTILTLGSTERGGTLELTPELHLTFWKTIPEQLVKLIYDQSSHVFVDWDVSLFHYLAQTGKHSPFPLEKVGGSVHCKGNISVKNLVATFTRLTGIPAKAFLKFVLFAKSPDDPSKIWLLFSRHQQDPRPLIAFAAGEQGMRTRFKCLLWGSAGTYGCIPNRVKPPVGQVPINVLLDDGEIKGLLNGLGFLQRAPRLAV